MAEYTDIRVEHELRAVDLDIGQDVSGEERRGLTKLAAFLESVSNGVRHAKVTVNAGASALAARVATFGTTDGNLTINGVAIAYTGASAAARAADAAAKVNAHANLLVSANVEAVHVAGASTVNIRSRVPGTIGNMQTIAITGTGASVPGANLTGGTDGASMKTYRKGL